MCYAAGQRRKEALKCESASMDAKRPPLIDHTRLTFHSDQGATDLIALLCLTKSKSGGESKWVSGIAIHNELLRRGRKVWVAVLVYVVCCYSWYARSLPVGGQSVQKRTHFQ